MMIVWLVNRRRVRRLTGDAYSACKRVVFKCRKALSKLASRHFRRRLKCTSVMAR